jgi:hypothetical protein
MSSKAVRDSIKTFFATEIPGTVTVDLTAEGKEMQDFLSANSLTHDDDWNGLTFGADPERGITIPASNTSGKYREEGFVFVHVVTPIVEDTAMITSNLIDRAEVIKNLFRGMRIDDILILSVSQPNFESGATLEFEGGFQSCSMLINYQKDLNL